MPYSPALLKAQYPILSEDIAPGVPLHYLDNGATGQMPRAVLDAVVTHETRNRANVKRSVHTLAERATNAYDAAREDVAAYLNVSARDLVFTAGCTMAINLVAHSYGSLLREGDAIAVSTLEHHANMVPWQMLAARRGLRLVRLPATAEGRLDMDALPGLLDGVRLVAITHASNVTGAITPVAEVAAQARAAGAVTLVDGAQMAPHGPVDVPALGCDFYVISGHKLGAPNGIGALWGRRELLAAMPPFLGGGEMIRSVRFESSTYARPPQRFEAGTPPIGPAVGLGAACRFHAGIDHAAANRHLAALTGRLIEGLRQRCGDRLRLIGPGDLADRLPLVSFTIKGAHPHDICQILDRRGVALRGGHHCAQVLHEAYGVAGSTRASMAAFNDAGDIDACLAGIEDALRILLP
ncbi:MAG: aminotransferase class V-fold PLP-dependent enzyme [Zavarzinia sp.]|nr:aminotransferase class V-fold PLP-dependent enzyme [Zavarzinia sp.]